MRITLKKLTSRRGFLKAAVISSVLGIPGLRASAVSELQNHGENKSGAWLPFIEKICPVIDCNLHALNDTTGFNHQWVSTYTTSKEFVDYLNLCGVDYGIVKSSFAFKGIAEDFIQANKETLALLKKHPKRFLPAIHVNPNHPDEAVQELITYRTKHGVFWVGELTNYLHKYDYSSPGFARILDTIAEYDMVCHIHSRLHELEPLVKKYPHVTFALPHFTPERERIFSRIEFVKQYPNVHLDICGLSFSRIGILEHAVNEIGADRILFGSDFEFNDPAAVIARVLNAKLSLEVKKKIFYENAKRLIEKFDHEKKFISFLV